MEPLKRLKQWLIPPEKKGGKYQYLLLVLCIGGAFMLASNTLFNSGLTESNSPASSNKKLESKALPTFGSKKNSTDSTMAKYETTYEKKLRTVLEDILGINNVSVFVYVDSTNKQVLEKNSVTKSQTTEETDKNGGERKVQDNSKDEQVVTIRDGEKEVPIITETKKPEITGVIVVAKGAENIEVKALIKEAVTRALGVPSFRVGVYPKK